MTVIYIIWATAAILYTIFWLWYVGFRRPLSTKEIDHYIGKLEQLTDGNPESMANMRQFLENDTGKSFAMVNSIVLKKMPDLVDGVKEGEQSLEVLMNYVKPFMKMMIRRGGIAIFQGRAAGKSVDVINIDNADEWQICGINRFRSRRDMMEILTNPKFHEKHELKFAALDKSIAYPVDPWFQLGGFPLTVALILALIAAILHIILG